MRFSNPHSSIYMAVKRTDAARSKIGRSKVQRQTVLPPIQPRTRYRRAPRSASGLPACAIARTAPAGHAAAHEGRLAGVRRLDGVGQPDDPTVEAAAPAIPLASRIVVAASSTLAPPHRPAAAQQIPFRQRHLRGAQGITSAAPPASPCATRQPKARTSRSPSSRAASRVREPRVRRERHDPRHRACRSCAHDSRRSCSDAAPVNGVPEVRARGTPGS